MAVSWTESGGWWIDESRREAWLKSHPGADLDSELASMHTWLLDNPSRRPKSRYSAFVTKWLNKVPGARNPPKGRSSIDRFEGGGFDAVVS